MQSSCLVVLRVLFFSGVKFLVEKLQHILKSRGLLRLMYLNTIIWSSVRDIHDDLVEDVVVF